MRSPPRSDSQLGYWIIALVINVLWIFAVAGWANAGEGPRPVTVILSDLPPEGSVQARKLRAAAGVLESSVLELTQCERWTIPVTQLDALKAAANEAGVGVMEVDSAMAMALVPMTSNAPMSKEQSSMMDKTMGAKGVVGAGMMELPDARMIEHAMTDRMDDTSRSSRLVIPLTKERSTVAVRTGLEKTADGYVWRGRTVDGDEPVTLMWWPSGRMTGQVVHQGRVYAIRHMGGAMHAVVEMSPAGLPPEHAPMGMDAMKKMKLREDPLVKMGDPTPLRALPLPPGSERPERANTKNLEDASGTQDFTPTLPREPVTAPPHTDSTGPPSSANSVVEIALLVGYTKAAASQYTNIQKDLIELAVADANASFVDSGIGNVRLKLVHAYETDYAETGSHFDHVFGFADKGDGKMEDVHQRRDDHKADVAVLIVDDQNGCGLAAGVAPGPDRAFAVVHHMCAAVGYSLAHEIGHILGARHDIGLDDSKAPFPFGHGFVHGTEWRTMMSYKDSCGGCPRLPIWSNPDVRVRGVAAGDAFANNARVIAEQAATVAGYR